MDVKKQKKENVPYHWNKKIMMGIGLVIFGFVLWASSSLTALQTNLNWPAAFIVLGILSALKGIYHCYEK